MDLSQFPPTNSINSGIPGTSSLDKPYNLRLPANLSHNKASLAYTNFRELKHQTFSTGRRQPEVQFTSDPRFPPTGSTVATSRRLCFAYFDVACKTWVSLLWFSCFYIILPAIFCTQRYVNYYSIVLAFLRAIVKYLKSVFQLFSL